MATPLHNHTYFSAYDGLSKPRQIAERCVELGYEACGCTDHDLVAGHVEFNKELTKAGVKPIFGIETYQSPVTRHENFKALRSKETGFRLDNFHLILLAMNNTGLSNLWAMNTEAHRSGFYYNARVDWELLEKYNEGIIATSACGLGMIQQAIQGNPHLPEAAEILQKYLSIFGDRFYLELSTYPADFQVTANLGTATLAYQFGVPTVYGNDAHYATPDQYELHEKIMALQQNKKITDPTQDEDPKGRPTHSPDLYIMAEDDVREHLSYMSKSLVDETIANSDTIASLCNATLPESRFRMPTFVPDKGWSNGRSMLFDLVQEGYQKKVEQYDKDPDGEYFARIDKELSVIFAANLGDYFLMVRDYVKWAKDNGVMVGPGRGSVGGSLVAWLLGITEVDPIRYGLIFERFYNAGRAGSLPDIDIDFSRGGREKVKQYVSKKFGAEYVADIGTVMRLQPVSAINDSARVLGIPQHITKGITKIIKQAMDAGIQPHWEGIMEDYGDQLAGYMDQYPALFEMALALAESETDSKDDHVKTYGTHASGVIIGDEPLGGIFPLRWVTKEKKLVSQWDMRDADDFGYMKADLLGLRNLDTLGEVNEILVARGQEPIQYDALQYQEHPEEMWELLDHGQTVGLFQVEDGGSAKQVAKAIKARDVEGLGIVCAMNRPGPLRSGAVEKYIKWRETGEVDVQHELVAEATRTTGGVFLYQEQVIEFFTLLGYSLTEADDIRALMGKKKVEKLKEEYPRYMKAAANHMDEATAESIWLDLVGFAKYGFNKSHAIEYGIILLWTMYAKFYYPEIFTLASIRTVDKDKQSRYVREAQRLGMTTEIPVMGKANVDSHLTETGIMFGWSDISGIGKQPATWIKKHTWEGMTSWEFLMTVDGPDGKITIGNGTKRTAVDRGIVQLLLDLNMFPDYVVEYTKAEQLELEEKYLGIALSDESSKVLNEYAELIGNLCVPYAMTEEPGEYAIAGVIQEIQNRTTKNGKPYAVIKIQDDSDETEFFVWNEELRRLDFIFRHRTAGIFNIKKTDRGASLIDAAILHTKATGDSLYERSKV